MAIETVKTFELKINGINSVKELKQHISDLRDRLVALDDTSEEYSQTVDELVDSQKKLSSVMSASKESITGATGSYNSLVNEMSALKKVWREVTSEAERAKIGTRINEINEELKRMDSTIGNSQRKVGSYEEAIKKALMTPQQELKKLKKELAGMEQGTAEYNATFARMAQLTHDVTEQQEMLKWSSADLGDILGNLVGVAQGVAGGFSAINAVSGLISDGNEDVEEAMLTAQRWLQLIQGLSALEELGDRIKGLWQGLKNYAQSQNTAVASMGDFSDKAEAVEGTATQVSTTLNTQSTIMKQTTSSAKELAEGMKLLSDAQLEEIERTKEMIVYTQDQINSLQLENLAIREKIKLGKIERGEGEMLIQINQEMIDAHTEELDVLKQKSTTIKKTADANKVLSSSEKAVATSTSWLKKQVDLLDAKFKTMSASSNVFVAGMGKAGSAVIGFSATIKAAISSTGIGLLIVLLGSAVSWLLKFVDGSAKAEERTKKLKDSVDALNESLEKQEKSWEREEMLLEAQGASYEDIYEARRKNLQAQLAEVRANLATQKAIAEDIGKRRLQKAKYDEFRQTLEELEETEKNLAEQISDLDYEKYIKGIKDAREEQEKQAEAEKKQAEDRKRAWQDRQKQIDAEKKKAEDLYKSTLEYFKDEKTKLREKYEEEKALLEKYGKSTIELTQKYEKEKTAIILAEMKTRFDKMREFNERQDSLLGEEDYLKTMLEEAQAMADDFNQYQNNFDETGGSIAKSIIDDFNAVYGLSMEGVADFEQQMRLANKAVEDARKALLEFQSAKIMDKLGKDFEKLGNEAQISMDRFEMSIEETATRGSEVIKGFYTGITPEEMRSQLEARYQLQAEYLQKELDLYIEAQKQKNLTDEDRATIQANINAIQVAQQDLMTQKTIESNYLMIESYENMANSIEGIAGAMGDILGSVSDLIMDNAESQLEAGEITEEEYNRQFEKAKAIQIAQATINTIAGAVGAFMGITRDTGGWGIALAIAQATAVLASGIVQIQKIKNTKPNGSGSSGGSSGRYAEVMPNPTSDYNPTLTQNVTNGQETENLANALSKTPLRAYVVESDITNAQGVAQQRTKESSF